MSLQRSTRRNLRRTAVDLSFRLSLFLCLAVGFVMLGYLLVTVVSKGLPRLDGKLLTDPPSFDPHIAGARPAILATLWMMGVVFVFSVPIGIGTAIYLEEYARRERWYNRLLEVNIQNLAAVPAIVYGILGLAFLVRGLDLGRITLAGGLILTLVVLPTVIVASREAIRSVPSSIRQAAYALGATKWQVVWRQVLPAAVPGIATGTILAMSRAIGETAPLLLIGALTYVAFDPSLFSQFSALPVLIYDWTRQPSEDFRVVAAAGVVVLVAILLVMNSLAVWIRYRYQKRW